MNFKLLPALGVAVLLTACASNLQALKHTKPSGDAFTQALTREYAGLAESEANQYDWRDSEYFAKKGLRAAKGEAVQPEELGKRKLPAAAQGELGKARERLGRALTNAKLKAARPADVAAAQGRFDCWVEQQEEVWQGDEYTRCRTEFLNVMRSLDGIGTHFTVHFKSGSTAIDKAGSKVLKDVVKSLQGDTSYVVRVEGHADRVGDVKLNRKLAQSRAEAVRATLVKLGVKKKSVVVAAQGEDANKVKTADNVASHENRRVEIVITD